VSWNEIWEKRARNRVDSTQSLEDAIEVNGYSEPQSQISATDWQSRVNSIAKALNLNDKSSLFEVGCGSGSLLKIIMDDWTKEVGGCDASVSMVEIANKFLSLDCIFKCLATAIPILPRYQNVIAHGLIHYLKLEDAEKVLASMIQKAESSVGIFDIPDLELERESESYRRASIGEEKYNILYHGSKHTYFSREWFKAIAVKYSLSFREVQLPILQSNQDRFRFHVIFQKD
jgi:trans-aconitate methyltransferase